MVNKVFLVGRLGDAPQARAFPDGSMLSTASLATNEHWRDKQTMERHERTDWHRLVFHARLAEVAAQYLRKGSKIFVEGQLRTRKWQAEDGSDRYVIEVHVRQMEMLDRKPDGAPAAAAPRGCAEIDKGARAYAAASGGSVPAQPPAAPVATHTAGGIVDLHFPPAAPPAASIGTVAAQDDFDDIPF